MELRREFDALPEVKRQSYEQIAQSNIQSLEGFLVRKSGILPLLTPGAKKKRLDYCKLFWIFWKSARALAAEIWVLWSHAAVYDENGKRTHPHTDADGNPREKLRVKGQEYVLSSTMNS